jgi:ferric-dicitrate binding protein FerR (iron transport regulator)
MTNNNNKISSIKNLINDRLNSGFEEQAADAARVISEIESVDSTKAFRKVQARIQDEGKLKLIVKFFYRAAAVLFIPLLVASGILFLRQFNHKEIPQFAIQEITSPPGVRSRIVLPDGSNVWLNAESTIKFKVPFDKSSRDIALSGEAFFDVQKNPVVPFIVMSGKIQVTVHGTRFNYKAFEDEDNIEVVLEEGKIGLNTIGGKKDNELIMKPGERAVIEKPSNKTNITSGTIDKYIAWHNGKLVFDETPMPDVATELGRWFGIEVIIDDPRIRNYRITTTFENESLHQVLELLRLSSPINIKYIPATIDKTNKRQTKSKIIFTKKV